MLEYNFSALDDDFITLWSQYILYNDTSAIIKPLITLAECGQINAIQCWYLLKKPEEQNQTIDNLVDSFYGDSFNEALAIAHRIYANTKSELKELKEQIAYWHNLGKQLYLKEAKKGNLIEEQDNIHFISMNTAIKQFKETEYAKQLIKAAQLTEDAAENSRSALIWERLFELYSGNPLILDNERMGKVHHNHIKKALLQGLTKDPNDAVVKFTLAKNLTFYHKDKKGANGSLMLIELAKRPLKCCSYKEEVNE